MTGSLVLAATPIGDVEDASPRLRRLLVEAEVVAAEDTRRLLALAARLELRVAGRIVSYHEHNETARADELLDVVARSLRVRIRPPSPATAPRRPPARSPQKP